MSHIHPPRLFRSKTSRASLGFTLVELMVGLVLGMLTVLVITEVTSLAEGKKRTVSSGSDAQVNGALSLYTLQRDIQMAGYGAVGNLEALGCAVKGSFKDPAAPAATPAIAFSPILAPVVIKDGANGAPDEITVLQSRKANFSAPLLVTKDHAKAGNSFTVKSAFGVAVGDLMIAVPAEGKWDANNWCSVFSVTDDGAATPTETTLGSHHVPHVAGGTSKWNSGSVFPDSGYLEKSYLLNMGSLSFNTYSVNAAAQSLDVTARTAEAVSATESLYPQIVNMQAMYGKAAAGTGQVSSYDAVAPTTAADWKNVLAIRIAVVTRSTQYEKEAVTSKAPSWDVGPNSTVSGATTCGSSKCVELKISHVPDWEHYRYKVYDTIVPLRNMLWNSAATP
ncbi:type IV pilus assembly protein PilW [Variovorax beijingensis]|uniref:Type IV pilus assembly protein PilW n=2 Tax=Variovorax TaxID=34072 RepID=A0AAE4BXQ9_VARPD|nr:MULTISPECIES: PilW family protein [Variovorax]MDR6425675.1 type IV pilus assembly protein PilW [Variovorax paradoxus]TWD90683.1 type IV pilus assembly protein PilW [Variovorax beijingensis]